MKTMRGKSASQTRGTKLLAGHQSTFDERGREARTTELPRDFPNQPRLVARSDIQKHAIGGEEFDDIHWIRRPGR